MTSALNPDQASMLYELSCALTEQLEFDALVPIVIERCRTVMQADGVAVLLLDPKRDELYFPFASSERSEVDQRLRELRVPADQGVAGATLATGKPQLVANAVDDPRWYSKVDASTGQETGSLMSVPLRTRRGIVGLIQVVNRRGRPAFRERDLELLVTLAGPIAIALDNAMLYGELQHSEQILKTQVDALRRDVARHDRFASIIGSAPPLQAVLRLVEKAAASPISVLITGETGTGKELVARAIHSASTRADAPFLAVSCAALPADLVESELFGHLRGSFTGAAHDRVGLFEAAAGGSVFLDELGELPVPVQVKLLRVLQEHEVTPLGSNRPRAVDIRLISATNRDLEADVEAGRFREDLYYRIAAFPIEVPSLRERREDIPLLVEHFVAKAAKHHGRRIAGVEPETYTALQEFDWPGNIRELENEIERAVAMTNDGDTIAADALSEKLLGAGRPPGGESRRPARSGASLGRAGTGSVSGLREAREAFEADYIRDVLAQNDGNITHAARALGISRVMLQRKMVTFGLR